MSMSGVNHTGISSMESKLICNAEMEIVRLTEEYFDEAVQLMLKYFVGCENITIATNLAESVEATCEFEKLVRGVLIDRISFGAKHVKTNQLVGVVINKIYPTDIEFENIQKLFETDIMMFILDYLTKMETTYNIFKNRNMECVCQVEFLAVNPNFGKRNIGKFLFEHSYEFASQLALGLHSEGLPERLKDKRPEAVTSVLTSLFTQKIGRALDFETLYVLPYSDLSFRGRNFRDVLNPIHEVSTFAAKNIPSE